MKFRVGDSASISKTVSEQDVRLFGEVSGDYNPVHFDEDYAANTRFKKRIAHGMLSGALISAVLGTKCPGPGCIYLKQQLAFVAPVFLGDEIRAVVTVTEVDEAKSRLRLETVCLNQGEEIVTKGEALVMWEEPPKRTSEG